MGNSLIQTTYVFDVLPARRRPYPLESLTSWVTALGEANGITSVDGVSHLAFPSVARRTARNLTDFGPTRYDELPEIALINEATLDTLTLRPFVRKFGRSTSPQAVSRFLSGSLNETLVWCPLCIEETPYYRLPWRFTYLTACPFHACYLVDRCHQCGATIPLYASPPRIGVCPDCQAPLIETPTNPAEDVAVRAAEEIYDDLRFLIEPLEIDVEPVLRIMGGELQHLRLDQNFTGEDLASITGVPYDAIKGIENGDTKSRGSQFDRYWEVFSFLGVSFRNLFEHALWIHAEGPERQRRDTWEAHMLRRVKGAVADLQGLGIPINFVSVADHLNINPQELCFYSDAMTFIRDISEPLA